MTRISETSRLEEQTILEHEPLVNALALRLRRDDMVIYDYDDLRQEGLIRILELFRASRLPGLDPDILELEIVAAMKMWVREVRSQDPHVPKNTEFEDLPDCNIPYEEWGDEQLQREGSSEAD